MPHTISIEEMRNDLLNEHKMGTDLEYALESLDKSDIEFCINKLEMMSSKLSIYRWEITPKELLNHFL